MNMILAVLLLAVVLMQGDRVLAFLSRPAVIGVVQADSPAAAGGMQPGDEVIRINGRTVSTWEDLEMAVTSKRRIATSSSSCAGTARSAR